LAAEAPVQLDRPFLVITPTVDGDVLAALARADSAFTGRGVHQLIGRYSAEGVRRALDRLVTQGVVATAPAGRSKLYRLNRDHLAAPSIVALAQLREELFIRIRDRLGSWVLQPEYAALFGSATKQMVPESDIDVFIVRPNGTAAEDSRWTGQLEDLVHDGSRWTGNDVRVLEMSAAGARLAVSESDGVLCDIRDYGIRLAGPVGYLRVHNRASGAR
jgi:hypothetical protein